MEQGSDRPASKLHVAIIMDGNGRWAASRGRARSVGHRLGVRAVRRVVESAPGLGIGTLTLFAFSSDNWQRPASEVGHLMRLFHIYLRTEVETCVRNGVRLSVIGQRDELPPSLRDVIEDGEAATAGGQTLHLRIAMNYSARSAIMRAACRLTPEMSLTHDTFARLLGEIEHADAPAPNVDLLIRTGGEQRLSDFLLWECAYAELVFTSRLWPDFTPDDLAEAVREFHRRERRFGRVPLAVSG